MRVLLIACQFLSKRSPRALRWHYLTRELTRQGHEVHVLTPGLKPATSDKGNKNCHLHIVFPGPVAWLLHPRPRSVASDSCSTKNDLHEQVTRLNWKGRLAKILRQWLSQVRFPGEDAEWLPWANRRLASLLKDCRPDIVISSHEPASSLLLGLKASRRGVAWVADLGDPVCAPYTSRRWRKQAMRLEAACMHDACCIIVPNERAKKLYVDRHGVCEDKLFVLPQGYDDSAPSCDEMQTEAAGRTLSLVFAGRVYPFRDPGALLQAVRTVPRVHLTMILADPPDDDLCEACAYTSRIRFMHALPHERVRKIQWRADVLVNIGNAGMPAQIPSKIFEYMGIPRPIWHLYALSEGRDMTTGLVECYQRGWCCPNGYEQARSMLENLVRKTAAGQLTTGLDLEPVKKFAVSEQGFELSCLLRRVVAGHRERLEG